jgi:5'-3' exoribonuclease 1
MNGIIHRCSHPSENALENTISEQQIFINIFNYIDRLFHVVSPRLVFFMAVDGVAPRAKMNQQRARRFRSAHDAAEARRKAVSEGQDVPDAATVFDSNCITPGTDFMHRLSDALQFFVHKKIAEDAAWRKCRIILSGHEVPGEGEHKIQEFIRHSKAQASWAPNQSHVVHGLDADLVMLGLATHEPNFCLLREEVLTERARRGIPLGKETFWVLHLAMFREYLQIEFESPTLPFEFDIERIVDDFIVMCYFVGNDFLPNMPYLDIASGSLDKLFQQYKTMLPQLGGYLSDGPAINVRRLEAFIASLAHVERGQLGDDAFVGFDALDGPGGGGGGDDDGNDEFDDDGFERRGAELAAAPDAAWHEVKSKGTRRHEKQEALEQPDALLLERIERARRVPRPRDLSKEERWRHPYYAQRFFFGVRESRPVVQRYFEGLNWVLQYYHMGVPSWGWFYPYHYTPLASDMVNLHEFLPASAAATPDAFHVLPFALGQPFLPYQQLLGVLPPASSKFMPAAYARLMVDAASPIHDFYPERFAIDMEGKKSAWEGVVLLDFIDEKRLVAAHDAVDAAQLCSTAERLRNTLGIAFVYAFDAASLGTLPSAFPEYFDALSPVLSKRSPLLLPPLPATFRFRITPGTGLGVLAPPGFPSLQWRAFHTSLHVVPVNIFGGASRLPSQVLRVLDNEIAHDDAADLVDKHVWLQWPNVVEARVSRVEARAAESSDGRALAKELQYSWLVSKAVELPKIEPPAIVYCRRFKGMNSLSNGARVKVFADEDEPALLSSLLPFELFVDTRFTERTAPPLSEYFQPGVAVVSLHRSHYGCVGTVVSRDAARGTVTVALRAAPSRESLLTQIVASARPRTFPLYEAARKLGMSVGVLARVTSDVFIDGMRKKMRDGVNIGLELKSNKKQELVVGYCEQDEQGRWLLTLKAITLIADYRARFPVVFAALEKHQNDKSGSLPQASLLTPEQRAASPAQEALKEREKSRNASIASFAAAGNQVRVPELADLLLREVGSAELPPARKRELHAQLSKAVAAGLAAFAAGGNPPPHEFPPMSEAEDEWLCAVIEQSGLEWRAVGHGKHKHIVCARIGQFDEAAAEQYELPPLGEVIWDNNPDFARVPLARKRELHDAVRAFLDSDALEHPFPASLQSQERKWLHAMLEVVGVSHESEGEGEKRRIVARKAGAPPAQGAGELREWEKPLVQDLLVRIAKYLKTVPSNAQPRVAVGSTAVTPECVVALEAAADQLARQQLPLKTVTMTAPFADLRRGIEDIDSEVDDTGNRFTLGERVIVVASMVAVPFGARGTVIGVEKRAVDVLFDERYMGGTSLLGRCSNLRGLRLPVKALMRAQPVVNKHSVGQHELRTSQDGSTPVANNNRNHSGNNNNRNANNGNDNRNRNSSSAPAANGAKRSPQPQQQQQQRQQQQQQQPRQQQPQAHRPQQQPNRGQQASQPPMPTMLLKRGDAVPIPIQVPSEVVVVPVAAAAPAATPGQLSLQQLAVLQAAPATEKAPRQRKKSAAAVAPGNDDDVLVDMSKFSIDPDATPPRKAKVAPAALPMPAPFAAAAPASAPSSMPANLMHLFAAVQQPPASVVAPAPMDAAFLANLTRQRPQQ